MKGMKDLKKGIALLLTFVICFTLLLGTATTTLAMDAFTGTFTDGFEALADSGDLFKLPGTNWFYRGGTAAGGINSIPTGTMVSKETKPDGVRSGEHSVLFTPQGFYGTGGIGSIQHKNGLDLPLNEWYIIEAYEKAASENPASDLTGRVSARYTGGGLFGSDNSLVNTPLLNNTEWTRVYCVFQATEATYDSTQGYKPAVGVVQSQGSDTDPSKKGEAYSVYIDDVSVKVVKAASVAITSEKGKQVDIPVSGSITVPMQAVAYNEFGTNQVTQRISWSIAKKNGTALQGVSIDASTGVVTISAEAEECIAYVTASQDGITSAPVALVVNPAGTSKEKPANLLPITSFANGFDGYTTVLEKPNDGGTKLSAVKNMGRTDLYSVFLSNHTPSTWQVQGLDYCFVKTASGIQKPLAAGKYVFTGYARTAQPDTRGAFALAMRYKHSDVGGGGTQWVFAYDPRQAGFITSPNWTLASGGFEVPDLPTDGYIEMDVRVGTFDNGPSVVSAPFYFDDIYLAKQEYMYTELETDGNDTVAVDPAGTVTKAIEATTYDNADAAYTNLAYTWSATDADTGMAVTGITFENTTGGVNVKIGSSTEAGKVKITATLNEDTTVRRSQILTLTKEPAVEHTVTVSITGDGKVFNGTQEIVNGATVKVANGNNQEFRIEPGAGQEVKSVTVGGSDWPFTNNAVKLENVTKDVALSVTFGAVEEAKPELADTSSVYKTNYDNGGTLVPSATVFTTLKNGYGWDVVSFGVEVCEKNGTVVLPLTVERKTSDGKYGVQVFGVGLEKGKTYVLTPYAVISKYGQQETETIHGVPREFTLE